MTFVTTKKEKRKKNLHKTFFKRDHPTKFIGVSVRVFFFLTIEGVSKKMYVYIVFFFIVLDVKTECFVFVILL